MTPPSAARTPPHATLGRNDEIASLEWAPPAGRAFTIFLEESHVHCSNCPGGRGPRSPARRWLDAKTLRWGARANALTLDPHAQNEGHLGHERATSMQPLISRDPTLSKVPRWRCRGRRSRRTSGSSLRPTSKSSATARRSPPTTWCSATSERSRRAPDFRAYISSIKEVKAIDPLTVHIVTNGANPILPDYTTSILIMSKAWSEKHNVTKPQSFKDKEEDLPVRTLWARRLHGEAARP